ncbi:MAG: NADPH-dependent FMN reductase [Pseudomonadota bacterium]
MTLKLLALAASNRAESLNKRLLALAVVQAQKAGAEVTVLDYAACASPLYEGEDSATLPNGAKRLSEALLLHDGLLLASPEYNWSIPAALKNLIDWLSIDAAQPLKGRSALLMCASPSVRGGILGLNQLSLPLAHLGMYVYPHLIAIGDANEQLSGAGINAKDQQFFHQCIDDFVRVTKTNR